MTSKIYQMKDGTVLAFPKTVGKAVENANGDTLENVEAGAQVNTIEKIQLDGTDQSIGSGKVVNLPVYTKTQVDAKISSTYKPGGSKAFAQLPALTSANEGFVYNVTDKFTTTEDFVEGAGKKYPAGTNVVIANVGTAQSASYKYDVLPGFIDTDTYDTHIANDDIHVTAANKTTWNGKQDAINSANKLSADYISAGSTNAVISNTEKSTYDGYASAIANKADATATAAALDAKQDEITSSAKLDADLVDDSTSTNKFVSASDKSAWNGKQDEITSSNKLSADLISAGSTNAVVSLTEKATYDGYASAIAGKQDEITSSAKLDADLVDDSSSTHKFVSAADKTAWNGKQDAIDGSHKISADYVDDSSATNKFVTASEKTTWSGKQDEITSSNKLSADLISAGSTNAVVSLTEKAAYDGYATTIAAKANSADVYTKTQSDARYLTFEIVETYEA